MSINSVVYTGLMWQEKLGAPRPSEWFRDLYEMARTAKRWLLTDKRVGSAPRFRNRPIVVPVPSASVPQATAPVSHTLFDASCRGTHPSVWICFVCRKLGHIARNCPDKRSKSEAKERSQPNSSNLSSTQIAEVSPVVGNASTAQLECFLAHRRVRDESEGLDTSLSHVNVVTVYSPKGVPAIGPTMYLFITVKGVAVDAVVVTALKSTIIYRSFLRLVGQSLHNHAG